MPQTYPAPARDEVVARVDRQAAPDAPSALLLELFDAYSAARRLASELPVFYVHKVRRYGRALRWKGALRWLVAFHIARSLTELRRQTHAQAALARRRDEDPARWLADVDAIERYERSLPGVPLRTLFTLFVLATFVGASLLAHVVFNADDEARLLSALTEALFNTSRKDFIAAFKGGVDADTAIYTLLLLLYSLWLALFLPASSFRLKRLIFSATPCDRARVRAGPNWRAGPDRNSVYELEARTFAVCESRTPREVPLDLIAQALLIVPIAGLALYGIGYVTSSGMLFVLDVVACVVLLALSVVPGWLIARAWRRRQMLMPAVSQHPNRLVRVVSGPLAFAAVVLPTIPLLVNVWLLIAAGVLM